MHRFIAMVFAAAMIAGAAAPAVAAESKSGTAPQSVAPKDKASGHGSGGGCYDEYPATSKPNA